MILLSRLPMARRLYQSAASGWYFKNMPTAVFSPELTAALEAADAADAVIAPLFRSNLAVEVKADRTPVTEADRRAEDAIRAVLQRRFPHYGFYGEEGGQHGMQAESIWLVDPLDGTKSFVRDTPFFSTQIALMRRGELVLGVSSACVVGERAWAERGGGAWLNGERIHVSDRRQLSEAIVSSGNLKTLAGGPRWPAFGRLIGEVNRIRGYGDFVHYHLLARGALDVVIESDVNILDIAALAVIVREAGGQFTDLAGRAVDLRTTSVLASNGPLHQSVFERIQFQG
jgi:histidinol-phosphatase